MEDDPLNAENEPDERKATRWGGRLKGKLPSRRRRSSGDSFSRVEGTTDAQVSDFLYSTGQAPDRPRLPAPKIDVSALRSSDGHEENFVKFRFSKPPRAAGLFVQFANVPPEFIGFGGDDADELVLAVSQRKITNENSDLSTSQYADQALPPNRRPIGMGLDITHPETGLQAPPAAVQPVASSQTFQNPAGESEDAVVAEGAQKGLRRLPDGSTSGDLRQRMRADEGRAFLSAASLNSPSAFRRKPVGESGSETSSLSSGPSATPQHLSPPPSRDSNHDVLQPPQYPPSLMSSHGSKQPAFQHRTTSSDSSLRLPSSGNDSRSRSPLRGRAPTSYPGNGFDSPFLDNHGSMPPSSRQGQPISHSQASNERFSPLQVLQEQNHPRQQQETRRERSPRNATPQHDGHAAMENCMINASLQEFTIATATKSLTPQIHAMPWRRVYVHRQEKDDSSPRCLKIVVCDNRSSFSDTSSRDRKFKLERGRPNVVTIHSMASASSGISIDLNASDPELVSYLQQIQSLCRGTETIQSYHFGSLAGAHAFQAAVTGHTVKFDGIAAVFAISRRRTVVPIHKSHEATDARIEIVKGYGGTFLVAFFAEYPLADCLCFELKRIDVFEALKNKDGLFCVKLVDAKFALPDPKHDEKLEFVSLPNHEYPSEHEDITIGFHDENVRDEFAAALPAVVKSPTKFTLKRRT